MKRADLTGQQFGRLTVLRFDSIARQRTQWLCRCQCGNETVVDRGNLRTGHTKSCGCLEKEARDRHIANSFQHGNCAGGKSRNGKATREYQTWAGMIQRCTNPNLASFKYWGGRGIKVCDRWLDFRNFLADMGPKPEGLTLERINNDWNYEPGNCKWATRKEQANNQRPKKRKERTCLTGKA